MFHTVSYSLPSEVQSQNTVEFYPPHTFSCLLDAFFQPFLFIVAGKLLSFWLKRALFIFSWLFSPWNGLKLYCLVAISNIILVVIMHIFDNRNNLSSWRIQIALKHLASLWSATWIKNPANIPLKSAGQKGQKDPGWKWSSCLMTHIVGAEGFGFHFKPKWDF